MRDPRGHRGRAAGRGGKARERLNMFQEARGITDSNSGQFSDAYTTGVLQAIASAAAPGAAGAADLPQWRLVGPDLVPNGQATSKTPDGDPVKVPVSGRVGAIAVDPSNRNHILCGSAGGGIWASFTRGASWEPRTDSMPTLTIGAIAFDPSSSATVYAGTGDGNKYWFLGQGMLRSTDGGKTWTMLKDGPFTGQGFFQIIVDPADSTHILAATTGGVYESANSGTDWSLVYAVKTWDISMQPGGGPKAEVLAGTAGGLQVSADGGHTWTSQALPGAPSGWERLAVSIAPSDPTVAYAFGASSDDPPVPYLWRRSGGVWTQIAPLPSKPTSDNDDPMGVNQAWFAWCVAAARDRTDQVYLGGYDVYRGDLSAGTWAWASKTGSYSGGSTHADQHVLVFDPADPAMIYCGCDGGLFRSPDRGENWVPLNAGLGIAEIEYLTQDNGASRWLLAGLQDNGSLRYTGTTVFEQVGVGDGGDCGVDQSKPGTCYHSYNNMGLARSTDKGKAGSFTDIDAQEVMKVPSGYKSLFYPPMGVAGSTVAQAGQSVFISRDAGATWTPVPLPLSAPPPDQKTTALYIPTSDLIYAATNNGRVFTITWSDGAWSAAELASPRAAYISAIKADPSNRIWVTMSQMGGGLVWQYDDSKKTWTDKTGKLPQLPINSIAFDDKSADRVWVSADIGVYQSTDGGGTWAAFFKNLPNALVTDLEFHPVARVLRAATRNRGIWEVAVDTPGSSVLPPGVQICAVGSNHSAGLEIFGVGAGNAPLHIYQNAPNSGWIGWVPLGRATGTSTGQIITSALAAATYQDGRLEVFARGPDGALWHDYTIPPDYGWAGWYSLGGFLTGTPVVAANRDGRLEVFARGPDGRLRHISQTASGGSSGWSTWESLSAVITTAPAAALNTDGRLEVFARGIDGRLGHISQTASGGSSSWSTWESLGGDEVITAKPAAAANKDGRLEVFARGPDGGLRQISQTTPGSGWSTWQSLGGATIGDPAVTRTQDGRLVVFARRSDGTLWNIYQSAPGTWSGPSWESRGGSLTSDPAVTINQDGRLEAFACGTDNALWHIWQSAPNGGWSAWTSMGSTLTAFPSS